VTLTPERLAELRQRAKWLLTAEPSDSAPTLDPKMSVFAADVVELVRAADNLNALLAAAEGCLHNYDVDVKEGAFYMEQEHDQFDILRAAIRRAKGEQP